jgi:nucleotide-binding universal stress UspA family protein
MSESIVVGTDGSDTAARAVDEAVRLAKALDAEIHIVSAYDPIRSAKVVGAPEGAAKVFAPLPDTLVNSTVDQAVASVRVRGVPVHGHAIRKDPGDALLEVADEVGASLIVVGSKRMHGAKRFVLGSVANKVSHHAQRNVLIVATDQ